MTYVSRIIFIGHYASKTSRDIVRLLTFQIIRRTLSLRMTMQIMYVIVYTFRKFITYLMYVTSTMLVLAFKLSETIRTFLTSVTTAIVIRKMTAK